MDIEDREHHLRTFEDLLYDSVYLLYFAFDINQNEYPDDVTSPLIRSSIMNSMLLLECGANCLIDALDLPSKFYNDIEKLPFLSKFEFFLNKNSEKTLDRGCKEVQAIAELKSIRDFYVHPKVKKAKYEHVVDNYWVVEYGKTKQLGFPRAPNEWGTDHAIIALKSVCNFYNKYFIEWCGFGADTVVDLLLSSDKAIISQPIGAAIDCVGGLDRAIREWNIDLKFLGKSL